MRHFNNLQALRGIAALLVILIHAMSVPDRMGAAPLVPYLWSVGPAGVDIFFVISGFIVTMVAFQAAKGPGTNAEIAREFAIKRLVRIYPIFWIAMLVFWLAYPYVTITDPNFPKYPMWQLLLLVQQSNYLMLAAWTLGFEVYFYLVMTVILLFWPNRIYRSLVIWGAISAVIVITAGFANYWLLFEAVSSPLLFEFLMGVLVAYLIQKNETRYAFGALALGIFLFVVGAELNRNIFEWQPPYRWLCFGPASALIVYGALALELRHGIVLLIAAEK